MTNQQIKLKKFGNLKKIPYLCIRKNETHGAFV